MHKLGDGSVGWRKRRDVPSVAEHGHAVGDRRDFLEPVRDVDDGHAGGLERPDAIEEPFDLPVGQRRRRFVHDQDARVLRERLRDLHRLLLRDAELVDEGARVEVHAKRVEQPPGLGMHPRVIDRARQPAAGLAPEIDVLRDVEIRDERELLEDDGDAQAAGVGGRSQMHGRAVDEDLARIRLMRPAQDPDERGLAGAVLAQQEMHFAGLNGKRDVFERANPRKGLGDPAHLEERWHEFVRYVFYRGRGGPGSVTRSVVLGVSPEMRTCVRPDGHTISTLWMVVASPRPKYSGRALCER